jgi:hypothetical protein
MSVRLAVDGNPNVASGSVRTAGIPKRGLPRASNRKYLFERLTWSSFVKVHKLMLKQRVNLLLGSRNESYPTASLTISLKALRLFLSIPGITKVLLYTGLDTLYVLLRMSLFSLEGRPYSS